MRTVPMSSAARIVLTVAAQNPDSMPPMHRYGDVRCEFEMVGFTFHEDALFILVKP